MQTDRPGDGVDQDGIRHGQGDDVGQVEIEEVGASQDGLVGDVTDHHEQHEDPGEQIEQRPNDAVGVNGGCPTTSERPIGAGATEERKLSASAIDSVHSDYHSGVKEWTKEEGGKG